MARAAQRFALGIEVARPLAAIRAWARGEAPALGVDEARRLLSLPTPSDQQARAEFGLGHWLWERGEREAAGRHFVRAGELAPHDFTIRRGTMPTRGLDPMGPEFRRMRQAWKDAGQPYYRPLSDPAG